MKHTSLAGLPPAEAQVYLVPVYSHLLCTNRGMTIVSFLPQYLWVSNYIVYFRMQEDSLRSGKSQKQLEQVINSTPAGLKHVYEGVGWKYDILPKKIEIKRFLLRWTAFAPRPLTVSEMTKALVINSWAPQQGLRSRTTWQYWYGIYQYQDILHSLYQSFKAPKSQASKRQVLQKWIAYSTVV